MRKGFIQNTLEDILKVKFRIEDPSDVIEEDLIKEEKKLFCKLINNIEKLHANEVEIYQEFEVSISTIADPYWDVIEDMIDFMYLPEAADVIWWYIHDRKDPSGKMYEWVDEGKAYAFNTSEDLFEYIRYKYDNKE
jgi:hypothetical protein